MDEFFFSALSFGLAANFPPSLESRGYLATIKVLAAILAVFGLLSPATAYQLVVANA